MHMLLRTLIASSFLCATGAALATPAASMQAIQYRAYGPSSVLELVSLPRPTAKAGEVLVKVDAAGVNSIDWELRLSEMPGFSPPLPVVPGFDFAGEVVALGDGVSSFEPGQKVFAMLPLRTPHAYAEYVNAPANVLALQPAGIDAAHAAAVPMVALTAWQALFDAGHLQAGQTVLIHGGAGGVGHMAVQLAKNAGAHVISTSSQGNLAFVRSIGADEVIDYRAQKFEAVVHGVDLVFDTVGGDTLTRSLEVLRKGGTIVTIAGRVDPETAKARGIIAENILVHPDAAELKQIAQLIEQGKLKAQIDTVYPLRDAGKAHDKSETRHLQGRLVLQISH